MGAIDAWKKAAGIDDRPVVRDGSRRRGSWARRASCSRCRSCAGDSKTIQDGMRQTMQAMSDLFKMMPQEAGGGGAMAFNLKPGGKTVAGVSLDSFETKMNLPEGNPGAAEAKQIMQMIYGPQGQTGVMGAVDAKTFIVVQGGNDKLIADAVAAAKAYGRQALQPGRREDGRGPVAQEPRRRDVRQPGGDREHRHQGRPAVRRPAEQPEGEAEPPAGRHGRRVRGQRHPRGRVRPQRPDPGPDDAPPSKPRSSSKAAAATGAVSVADVSAAESSAGTAATSRRARVAFEAGFTVRLAVDRKTPRARSWRPGCRRGRRVPAVAARAGEDAAAPRRPPARHGTRPSTTRPSTQPRNDIPGLPNFAKVSDGLYRGAQPTAEGFDRLKKMGVKTVVNLRSFSSDRSELKGTGLRYAHIYCKAWHPEDEDTLEFLKIAKRPRQPPRLRPLPAGRRPHRLRGGRLQGGRAGLEHGRRRQGDAPVRLPPRLDPDQRLPRSGSTPKRYASKLARTKMPDIDVVE